MSEVEYEDDYGDEGTTPSSFIGLIKIMISVLVVGLIIGGIIFSMVTLKTELLKVDVEFSPTAKYTNIQEIFAIYLYPILDITDFLAVLCHFYIFMLIIGFFIMSYKVGTKSVYLGISIFLLILSTYFSTYISNFYIDLLESEVVTNLVSSLTYFNFFLLNLPWFTFLIGLVGILISLINFQKPSTNELNYDDLY